MPVWAGILVLKGVTSGSSPMMEQNAFRISGVISVWIGNFSSEIELDDYMNLSREFEKDFGFQMNERDMPEICVEPTPVAVGKLVDGFSRSKSYGASVEQLATQQGIREATTMVIFFNCEYRPESAKPNQLARLQFLGVADFS